ncbi:MAG TPA: hypothetical protein VM364_04185 [Vicinamibacterales bacterium]|nr:hypothetical protein [Vicinamibacterales bacterium]
MRFAHAALVLLVLTAACAKADSTNAKPKGADEIAPPQAQLQSQQEQRGYEQFVQRVGEYLELHNRLAATLPKLPAEATPEQIVAHQRTLAKLIQTERATARRGDIFGTEAEASIKAVLRRVFGGPDGKQLVASIQDENPGRVKITLNGRYPDQVPLSTVPPQVLASLPRLPPELEYRFIDDRLILLDVRAHIIIDYIDKALPV